MRLLAIALLLAGCQTEANQTASSREVSLPRLTAEAGREKMEALLPGALSLDGRCLYVTAAEGDTRYLVVWPSSASIVKDSIRDLAHLLIRDAETGASVQIPFDGSTSPVVLSGGEIGNRRPDPSALALPIPNECSGPYWIAGSVLDAMPPTQPPNPPPPSQ